MCGGKLLLSATSQLLAFALLIGIIILHLFASIETLNTAKQLDGTADTSDEEDSEESDGNLDNDDEDDIDRDEDEDVDGEGGAEEEPLNSEDDVTDEDASDLFETENVVVCQYDKVRIN